MKIITTQDHEIDLDKNLDQQLGEIMEWELEKKDSSKIIEKRKPQDGKLISVRLLWMRDNHPEYLLELYEEGILAELVFNEVSRAELSYETWIDKGMDVETAKELRLDLLAPAEGMDISRKIKKIPEKEWKKILKSMYR